MLLGGSCMLPKPVQLKTTAQYKQGMPYRDGTVYGCGRAGSGQLGQLVAEARSDTSDDDKAVLHAMPPEAVPCPTLLRMPFLQVNYTCSTASSPWSLRPAARQSSGLCISA